MVRAADDDQAPIAFTVTDGPEATLEPVNGWPPARFGVRARLALGSIGVLALAGLLAVQHNRQDGQSRPVAITASSAAPASSPASQPPTLSPTTPQLVYAGRPLLDVPSGWQLFGRGVTSVVRIELAAGRVIRTPVPALNSGGPVSFVVTTDRVIVRPLDFVPGYAVLDGQPAQELAGPAMKAGPMLPGPDPEHVWTPSADGSGMRLTALGGAQGQQSLPVQPVLAFADQAGYAAFQSVGGVYAAGPHGLHRITTGELVAAGPTRWLTYDCNDSASCRLVVADRGTGARRALAAQLQPSYRRGLISPDGRTAALIVGTPTGLRLWLLDLDSGSLRPLSLVLDEDADESALVWSPDSRRLFAATAGGALSVVDAATSSVRNLAVNLPPLTQLALRTR